MSQPDSQLRAIAEAAYAAINDADLDAFLAVLADDVEFTSLVAEAEGTTFRGHCGARDWWRTVRAAFEQAHWELLEIDESGAYGVIHVRVSGSIRGVPVEQAMWQAVELRDGKAGWWAFFREEQDARAAVGPA
jgi:ketosteroid isomerase-like protein